MFTDAADLAQYGLVPRLFQANVTGDDDGTCVDPRFPWADKYLGYCVVRDLQMASLFCGLLSIVFWMFAQMPCVTHHVFACMTSCRQIVKNWRTGSVESLSLLFLVDWLCGDVTNLVGVVLTLDQHAITQACLPHVRAR